MPFTRNQRGRLVAVRLTPKTASDRIDGIVTDTQGCNRLRVAVTAAPAKDCANRALIKLLAKVMSIGKNFDHAGEQCQGPQQVAFRGGTIGLAL